MAYQLVTASVDLTKKIRYIDSWSFAENAGTPAIARVLIRDGSSSGNIVQDVRIAASDSKHLTFTKPLYCPGGVYVQVSAGTVRGIVDGR